MSAHEHVSLREKAKRHDAESDGHAELKDPNRYRERTFGGDEPEIHCVIDPMTCGNGDGRAVKRASHDHERFQEPAPFGRQKIDQQLDPDVVAAAHRGSRAK
ncbi:MAG: hypothetical protein J0H17_06940 [Rhizobiales bacterium]|nr:hypothetical protein [Hyphomicrobiales bacterium]